MRSFSTNYVLIPFSLVLLVLCGNQPLAAVEVTSHSFEGTGGLSSGQNFGVGPTEMDFTGTFGDQTAANHFGLVSDAALARTGTIAYFLDLGSNADSGGTNNFGFGGNFTGSRFDQAAGTFDVGYTFTASAYMAENPSDLITGGSANIHFEFYDAAGSLLFRNDSFGLQTTFNGGADNADATPDYVQITNTYSLQEAITNNRNDAGGNAITTSTLANIVSARAIVTGNNAGNTGGGQIFVDDFSFNVTSVPEPNSLLMAFAIGAFFLRRRR